MDEFKIIEGERASFQKQCEELSKQGFVTILETYRMIEYCGKLTYSMIMVRNGGQR